jgi:hypothetical protein
MVMTTQNFDMILMEPFNHYDNLFAVSARDAVDVGINDHGYIQFFNHRGSREPGIFSCRDIVNRGPILFDNAKLKELNYLDEDFAPLAQDDTDICFRSYRKGWIVGSYNFDYYSPLDWGTTRKNSESRSIQSKSEQKNMRYLIDRHADLLTAEKHGFDISL